MQKIKVVGTGLTGLVGSRIVELLQDKFEFIHVGRQTGVDIGNKDQVISAISHSSASVVLHLAAQTDVDGCEKDKELTWHVNVDGTHHIVQACRENNTYLIYASTDFVFDGTKEFYTEEDIPHPINNYGKTKYEGEKIVQSSSIECAIVRIAYPYRCFFPKKDFVRTMIGKLKSGETVKAVTDHVMTPTFIDDIALALVYFIENKIPGLFHVVGNQYVTPYKVSTLIADACGFDTKLIQKSNREEYFKGRAPRPFRLALKNDKIGKLGLRMKGFEEGLKQIKNFYV